MRPFRVYSSSQADKQTIKSVYLREATCEDRKMDKEVKDELSDHEGATSGITSDVRPSTVPLPWSGENLVCSVPAL